MSGRRSWRPPRRRERDAVGHDVRAEIVAATAH
jgi:hypothetical protein